MSSFLSPLRGAAAADFVLKNAQSGATVADCLLTAFESASRNKGLLGRHSLPEGHALLLAPTTAIHTFFMRFPIDVAFVAKDGRIVKIHSPLVPWRMAGAFRAYAVVEMPAGSLTRSGTTLGHRLDIVPRDASSGAARSPA